MQDDTIVQQVRGVLRAKNMSWYGLMVTYKFLLDFMYACFLKDTDIIYAGEVSIGKYIIGAILFVTIMLALPRKETKLYSIFLNGEFIITVAPIFCVLGWSGKSVTYALYVWMCMMVQIYLLRRYCESESMNRQGIYIKSVQNYVIVIMYLMVAFCLLSYIIYNGSFAGVSAFDFTKTYSIRGSLSYPYILSYLFAWCYRIIVPLLIVFLLEKKCKVRALIMITVEIAFFMATGSKFILFLLPVVLGIYFLSKQGIIIRGMYAVFSIGCAVTLILHMLGLGRLAVWAGALFGSRFLTYPAMLKFIHYELFSDYPKVMFAEGLLGRVFSLTNLYSQSIGNSVSNYYREFDVGVRSNTGYLGESYAQGGFFGMLLMTCLLVSLILLFEKVSNNMSLAVTAPLLVAIVVVLNDGALFTTILTYGFVILVVLCACLNKPNEESYT